MIFPTDVTANCGTAGMTVGQIKILTNEEMKQTTNENE